MGEEKLSYRNFDGAGAEFNVLQQPQQKLVGDGRPCDWVQVWNGTHGWPIQSI